MFELWKDNVHKKFIHYNNIWREIIKYDLVLVDETYVCEIYGLSRQLHYGASVQDPTYAWRKEQYSILNTKPLENNENMTSREWKGAQTTSSREYSVRGWEGCLITDTVCWEYCTNMWQFAIAS
jgi:hypothetical protein